MDNVIEYIYTLCVAEFVCVHANHAGTDRQLETLKNDLILCFFGINKLRWQNVL